ncbi:MAG: hypothetical protein ABI629_15175, partial [bacterium]
MAVLVLSLLLGFIAPAHAQTEDFFFHHSATPVTIPGGTTNSFLDMTAPLDVTPLVDERVLDNNQAQAFPTFNSLASRQIEKCRRDVNEVRGHMPEFATSGNPARPLHDERGG